MEQKKFTYIAMDIEGDVTTIVFKRPKYRNALNSKMVKEITDAVRLASDSLFLVFKGEGHIFSAGADIDYMRRIARMSYADNITDAINLANLFKAISATPSITISLVQGASLGGANGIVAACDFAIAATNTLFSFSEVKLGLVPATISPYVVAKIGRAKALELFISARQLDAKEAHSIGLLTHLAKPTELEVALGKLLSSLKQNSPSAMRSVKSMVNELFPVQIADQESTSVIIADARASYDGQEGLSAFLEKRAPSWYSSDSKGKGW